jgi:hypothetical protein
MEENMQRHFSRKIGIKLTQEEKSNPVAFLGSSNSLRKAGDFCIKSIEQE